MRPDPHRATIEAIARKLRDNACPNPDAVAAEVMAIIRGRGYKLIPGQADDWQHHGAGLPTPGSEGDRLRAAYRAQTGTGRPHG